MLQVTLSRSLRTSLRNSRGYATSSRLAELVKPKPDDVVITVSTRQRM